MTSRMSCITFRTFVDFVAFSFLIEEEWDEDHADDTPEGANQRNKIPELVRQLVLPRDAAGECRLA